MNKRSTRIAAALAFTTALLVSPVATGAAEKNIAAKPRPPMELGPALSALGRGSVVAGESTPMARVHGTLHIGDRVGTGEEVFLSVDWPDQPYNGPRVVRRQTDAQGRFAFTNVPPGEVRVGRMVTYVVRTDKAWTPMQTFSHTRVLFLEPGQDLRMDIGGTGRKITGQLVAPADSEVTIGWQTGSRYLRTVLEQPEPPAHLSDQEKGRWHDRWRWSPAGRAQRSRQMCFVVDIDRNGSFSVVDVPPGRYRLNIELGDLNAPILAPDTMIGHVSHTFVLPESDADAPFPLGNIQATLFVRLKKGDLAPPFKVPTLLGSDLALANLRGKYVLLDFWATWCLPCRKQLPFLKETYHQFGQNPRFALVGLNLDQDPAVVSRYVQKEKLQWTQGLLGPWTETELPSQYGVQGIPAVFLVDPEGRIHAPNLRGQGIMEAVAAVLNTP